MLGDLHQLDAATATVYAVSNNIVFRGPNDPRSASSTPYTENYFVTTVKDAVPGLRGVLFDLCTTVNTNFHRFDRLFFHVFHAQECTFIH